MAFDNLSNKVHDELAELAKKHPTWQSFAKDMERLADNVWHKVRSAGEQAVEEAAPEAVADAEKDLGKSSTPTTPASSSSSGSGSAGSGSAGSAPVKSVS